MIRFFQEQLDSGSGIGYQISSYFMMRSIERVKGFKWVIKSSEFKPFRHTFDSMIAIDDEYDNIDYLEADEWQGLPSICECIEDDMTLCGYSTPVNWYINDEIFELVKSELSFKENIRLKCEEFRNKFDSEVIGLHIRRGDYSDVTNGKFLCGADYYLNGLSELPDNLPILVFTNDKEGATKIIDQMSETIDASRFVLITDLYNDNELIDDSVGQRIDALVDYDGRCKYDYRIALTKIALERLNEKADLDENLNIQGDGDYVYSYDDVKTEILEIIKDLNEKYKQKIKSESYNHSYDFCLMTMCDYMIMANSTYSLWVTLLSDFKKVIYPMYWMQDSEDGDTPTILPDMGDYNQTLDKGGWIVAKSNYIGKRNPDTRELTILSFDDDF